MYEYYGTEDEPLMTEAQFARAVGLAYVTVRMKRSRGEIEHYRFGRAVRYSREQLEDFLAQAQRPARKNSQGRAIG